MTNPVDTDNALRRAMLREKAKVKIKIDIESLLLGAFVALGIVYIVWKFVE